MFLFGVTRVTHFCFVHPEVCVDNDHVAGVKVPPDLSRTRLSALWWRLKNPRLDAAYLDIGLNTWSVIM